jgi:hypothetical protein
VRTPGIAVALTGALLVAAPLRSAAQDRGATDRLDRPHALYVEILGKGGVYTVGYDYALTDSFGVGGGASYLFIDGEHLLTLAPYVNVYPIAGGWGAFVVQTGLLFVHVAVPSTVRGFSGTSSTGLAGQVSAGYELRGAILFRFLLTGTVGSAGFRPWAGIGLGWSL